MTELVSFPRILRVRFAALGHGMFDETYDRLSAGDMACWKANSKTYMQLGVETVDEIAVPKARAKAFNRLLRMRMKAADSMKLALRRAA